MEDAQIIELFFARSEDAISELDKKYGKLLGITEGNARLRLTRMRKQLKTYLTEQEVLV